MAVRPADRARAVSAHDSSCGQRTHARHYGAEAPACHCEGTNSECSRRGLRDFASAAAGLTSSSRVAVAAAGGRLPAVGERLRRPARPETAIADSTGGPASRSGSPCWPSRRGGSTSPISRSVSNRPGRGQLGIAGDAAVVVARDLHERPPPQRQQLQCPQRARAVAAPLGRHRVRKTLPPASPPSPRRRALRSASAAVRSAAAASADCRPANTWS